jgi:hypothetical protein
MKSRRIAAGIAAAAAIGGLATTAVSTPASADVCGATRDVYISGAESHYTITCSDGFAYVNGRVKDTRADGHCAQVKAQIGPTFFFSSNACPSGTVVYFSWRERASSASVWTYLV